MSNPATALGASIVIYEDESARFDERSDDSPLEDVELGAEADSKDSSSSNKSTSACVAHPSQPGSTTSAEDESALVEEKVKAKLCSFKVVIGLLLLAFIIFVIVDSTTTGHVRGAVQDFLDWIEDNPIGGFFVFVVGKSARRKFGNGSAAAHKNVYSAFFLFLRSLFRGNYPLCTRYHSHPGGWFCLFHGLWSGWWCCHR